MSRVSLPWELFFGALVVCSAIPLWVVDYLPIQDLPQHLAAIRVLHSHGDEALQLSRYFDVEVLRTQYLAYYVAADILAYPFGVELANRILLTIAVAATPYSMAALLRALGRDERAAVFVLPLTYNAHLMLGFMNFVAAIPLTLAGLAIAVRLRREPTRRGAILLGVCALLAFYTHVVPFAFLGLGVVLIAVGAPLRALAHLAVPLVPSGLAAILWSRTSAAGQSTMTAALLGGDEGGPQASYAEWGQSLHEAPIWLTDIFRDPTDERLLIGWALLVVATFAIGAAGGAVHRLPGDTLGPRLVRRLGILAPLAGLAYFVTPTGYDWIWPINARFPLLCLIFLIVVIPLPRRLPGIVLVAALALVSLLSFQEVTRGFIAVQEEVGSFDDALETIPEGRRVAGLIFGNGMSREMNGPYHPFLHAVAYYQARKGGAVMFTFADFPQSPFQFREEDRPPRVPPRWEWTPDRVDPVRDLAWYEYVLVRGGPGRIGSMRAIYEPVYRSPEWSVWRRLDFRE